MMLKNSFQRRLKELEETVAIADEIIVLKVWPPGCTPPPDEGPPRPRYRPGSCLIEVIPPPPPEAHDAPG